MKTTTKQAALQAGRELDTLVHAIVFGGIVYDRNQAIRLSNETENGKRVPFDNWYAGDFYLFDPSKAACGLEALPHYSTDIAAAWQVVEKLKERLHFKIRTDDTVWAAAFGRIDPTSFEKRDGRLTKAWAWAETAPLAICRAALAAVTQPL